MVVCGGDQDRLDSRPDDASSSVLAVAVANHLTCLVAVLLKAGLLVYPANHVWCAALVAANRLSQGAKCGLGDVGKVDCLGHGVMRCALRVESDGPSAVRVLERVVIPPL